MKRKKKNNPVFNQSLNFVQEKGSDEIVLKAMGRAINKTVMITELIKVGLIRFSLSPQRTCINVRI